MDHDLLFTTILGFWIESFWGTLPAEAEHFNHSNVAPVGNFLLRIFVYYLPNMDILL